MPTAATATRKSCPAPSRVRSTDIRTPRHTSARVGTLAWNGFRHFELYYGVAGMGAVIHTVNPRLFPEQLVFIVNDAEDRYVFFDLTFAPLVEKLAPACKGVKGWVAMTDRAHMPQANLPNLLCYEELIAREDGDYEWPQFDEWTAAGLCYTSGTSGNPKGVLYANRSTILHAYAASLPDVFNCSARSVILPVVPMFHVNAWGIPYFAPLNGAKLVFPGAGLDGKNLYELFEVERVTASAGVPTVWLALSPGDDRCFPRRLRRALQARLGNDRDEPARQLLHAQGQARSAAPRKKARGGMQAGPDDLRRRNENRRRRGQGIAARRQGLRRSAGARALDTQGILQERGRQPLARRMVSHGRRRYDRPGRLHADHRSLEGRDQVGRRMDQLDRPGEHRRGASGDR